MRIWIVFIISNVLQFGLVYGDCPDGWITFDGSCYFFSHASVAYLEARHLCEFHGAHLVHINTATEYTFLKGVIGDLKSKWYIIGLTDRETEGVWKWSDTNNVTTFTAWNPGEPNGVRDTNCVFFTQSGDWVDHHCTDHYQPICEKDVNGVTCKDGHVSFGDSCYLFSHETMHFVEAENYCRQHGSHLIHVNTALENTFIRSYLKGLKTSTHWLGLTDEVIEDIWRWYDTDTIVEYTDWSPGQPDQARAADCASFKASMDFHWADEPCYQTYQPICETKKMNAEVIVG